MEIRETITVTTHDCPQGHVPDVETANARLRQAVEDRLAGTRPQAREVEELLDETDADTAYDRRQRAGIIDEGEAWPLPHEASEMPQQPQRIRPGSDRFFEVLEEIKSMHLRKTMDYGEDADALANVRQGAEFVSIEPWRGCLVRMADKMQRLRTFCRTGRLVHEGVEDTLLDMAAYAAIALVLFREQRR
jgi:hypothetical protein